MKYHVLTMAAAVATVTAVRQVATHDAAFEKSYYSYTPAVKELGCYSALTNTLYKYGYTVSSNTAKACAKKCKYAYNDAFVMAMHASECYCGMDEVPPESRRVDDRYCGLPCAPETTISYTSSSDSANITCGGVRMLDLTGYKQQLFYTLISSGIEDEYILIGDTTLYDKYYNTSDADAPPPFTTSTYVFNITSTPATNTTTTSETPSASPSTGGAASVYGQMTGAIALLLAAIAIGA